MNDNVTEQYSSLRVMNRARKKNLCEGKNLPFSFAIR
jgi:hypothetical protein